jgi:hypothetical protein
MTPARRKALERIKGHRAKSRGFSIKKLLILVVLLVASFGLIKTQTRVWNGRDKISIAINSADRITISTFDPQTSEITNIYIPAETQVEASRELGTFRIKNIWRLGENEKVGGVLLSETITKNFKFPVVSWAESPALAFSSGDGAEVLKVLFSAFSTNLGLGDKLALGIFSVRVKNSNRVEIALAETAYLKKARLIDGEDGFLISGRPPQGVVSVFADPDISASSLRVIIKNETGETSDAESASEIIEVLGGKVSSLVRGERQDYDCLLLGRQRGVTKKVAAPLGCEVSRESPEGNFDLELRLGKGFAERF